MIKEQINEIIPWIVETLQRLEDYETATFMISNDVELCCFSIHGNRDPQLLSRIRTK